jgi:hypothetical protein
LGLTEGEDGAGFPQDLRAGGVAGHEHFEDGDFAEGVECGGGEGEGAGAGFGGPPGDGVGLAASL